MKNRKLDIIAIMLFVLSAWIGGTSLLYSIKNPELTQMQVFLHIPRSVIFDFKASE